MTYYGYFNERGEVVAVASLASEGNVKWNSGEKLTYGGIEVTLQEITQDEYHYHYKGDFDC